MHPLVLDLVLEHAAQGLVLVTLDGKTADAPSKLLERWFGPMAPGVSIWDYLFARDLTRAAWARICFDALATGAMPTDVVLQQLTTTMQYTGRALRVAYLPVDTRAQTLLVIVTDVTAEVERAAQERMHREVLSLVERDRVIARELIDGIDELLTGIDAADAERGSILARLHTVKGMASLFGLTSIADACDAAELEAAEVGGRPSWTTISGVTTAWRSLRERTRPLLQLPAPQIVAVPHADYVAAVAALEACGALDIAARLRACGESSTHPHLIELAERLRQLARRHGKEEPEVFVDDGGVRLDTARFGQLWLAFVHVLRNVVAHAIEPPALRTAHGKPARTRVALLARETPETIEIEVRDDGAGVDWDAVATRARALGIESGRDAVFAVGVSTRLDASPADCAGRGVGLAALKDACASLQGTVEIESEPGSGTTITCRIPRLPRPSDEEPEDQQCLG